MAGQAEVHREGTAGAQLGAKQPKIEKDEGQAPGGDRELLREFGREGGQEKCPTREVENLRGGGDREGEAQPVSSGRS